MTLEKVMPQSAFIRNKFISDFPSDKRKLIHSPSLTKPIHSQSLTKPIHSPSLAKPIHSPSLAKPIHSPSLTKPVAPPPYTKFTQDNLSFSNPRVLNRALSDNTFLTHSGISNKSWESSQFAPYSTDRKCPPKISYRPTNEVKLHTSLHAHKSDPSGRDRSYKKTSATPHTDSSVKRKSSLPTEQVSKTNQERITISKSTTCSREISLHFPPPMPKSSGQSSRSSAAKRSEKKDINPGYGGRSLNPEPPSPVIDFPTLKKRRPHSADSGQKETTTCSFLYFILKKKKVSRSPSRDTQSKKSNRKNSRSRSLISCSSAQSGPASDQALSPLDKGRRLSGHSLTSSRIPQHSVSSTQPPSVTSPSVTTPLLAPTSPPTASKHQKYTSRSRSKNRRERRHRTHKRAFKDHKDDRLRHEDLPPHPSLYNKTIIRSGSEPATLRVKPIANSNINSSSNINSNCNTKDCTNISRNNVNNTSDILSKPGRNSKPESSANARSAAVSSGSGGNRKDSTGDSAVNLRDKSQHSASKTDIEEDSHYQVTTSSSDQQSRQSFRSQSLPSFRGHRFQPDADTKVISDAEDFEYCPTDMKAPLHLSMCGCGFLGMYHLGVVSCLTLRATSLLDRMEKIGGASAGALMAAVLVTARDKIEESAEHVQNLAKEIRRKPLGALTPGYNFTRSLRCMLEDILPEDAHEVAQGKLFVSLTNADTKKNEMLSDFRSRDELIEALVASCYTPVYAGIKLPVIRGKKYIDGGLSDNLPRFETGRTITVSPFDGKSDIGPKQGQEMAKKAHFINVHNQDIQVNMNNFKKGAHAFFPPKRQTLQDYFEKGRYDASRFLIREGLYEINNQPQSKTVLYESSV